MASSEFPKTASEQPDAPVDETVVGLSTGGFHRIAYRDWGDVSAKDAVICVHGLTRQGHDFDHLAARLSAAGRRVLCPDLAGRGKSGWLADEQAYAIPQYCADMNSLIARTRVNEIDWVGTSLGGLIGIVMAGLPNSPVRRLIVNDIGPYISPSGLSRISRYVAEMPASFESFEEAEAYFREILAPYGQLPDAAWTHITRYSIEKVKEGGRYHLLCDPDISKPFEANWFRSLDLWQYWDRIKVPILILHGAQSDLLSAALCSEMLGRNRNARLVRFDDCGHVPALMTEPQIAPVLNFLGAQS